MEEDHGGRCTDAEDHEGDAAPEQDVFLGDPHRPHLPSVDDVLRLYHVRYCGSIKKGDAFLLDFSLLFG